MKLEVKEPNAAEVRRLMEQGISQRKAINLAGLGKGPGDRDVKKGR